jgi:predicted Zn-dependent protease
MSENIDCTKLINLIQKHQYDEAFQELSSLKKNNTNSFSLPLIKLFIQIETGQFPSAKKLINKLLKIQPEHQLLQSVSIYLKSDKKTPNPLNDFIESFIQYNQSDLSKMNKEQFNQLMHQILIKPYIK